ncbi:hypothetical protein M426DRAFT_321729 [Hypoxylon sp. CI-4A]|nr:hypothetical protein M426DRAFT_321729 [Hypoxylon sp. CI-4A]
MGWMWSSSSSPSKGPNSNSNSSSPEESNQSTTTATAKQVESEYSDPEIAKFMAQIQAEFGGDSSSSSNTKPTNPTPTPDTEKPASTPTTTSASQSKPSTWSSLWGSSQATQDPSPATTPQTQTQATPWTPSQLDPVSESLLPTTMSCRAAFDAAFHCNSLGGQWTSVYRAGGVRSCGEHWDDFWFCMRARAYSSPRKEDAIRDHYRRREYHRYFAPGRPSSADVWESRDGLVNPGDAFAEPLHMPDVSDEEWRRREIERRRLVQERLSRGE